MRRANRKLVRQTEISESISTTSMVKGCVGCIGGRGVRQELALDLLTAILESYIQVCSRWHAYIMEQGMAQHRGRHTGTTAPPDFDFVLDFDPDSYSYMPDPLAQRP